MEKTEGVDRKRWLGLLFLSLSFSLSLTLPTNSLLSLSIDGRATARVRSCIESKGAD